MGIFGAVAAHEIEMVAAKRKELQVSVFLGTIVSRTFLALHEIEVSLP